MEQNKINIKKYEAVIFDMDGVLIDSEPLWKIAMQEVFDSIRASLSKKDFEKTVGLRLDEVIEYWYNHNAWKGTEPELVLEKILDRMIDLIEKKGSALIGVIETLDFLKKHNYKIGLATSSYKILIEKVLSKLEIKHYFDITHSAEFEKYGKPHPDVYLHTAHELGISPIKCLVIEDSLTGVLAGKAAKMDVVCIPEKSHIKNPKIIIADYIYENMQQFFNEIKLDN